MNSLIDEMRVAQGDYDKYRRLLEVEMKKFINKGMDKKSAGKQPIARGQGIFNKIKKASSQISDKVPVNKSEPKEEKFEFGEEFIQRVQAAIPDNNELEEYLNKGDVEHVFNYIMDLDSDSFIHIDQLEDYIEKGLKGFELLQQQIERIRNNKNLKDGMRMIRDSQDISSRYGFKSYGTKDVFTTTSFGESLGTSNHLGSLYTTQTVYDDNGIGRAVEVSNVDFEESPDLGPESQDDLVGNLEL